jgi:hypothetical protein
MAPELKNWKTEYGNENILNTKILIKTILMQEKVLSSKNDGYKWDDIILCSYQFSLNNLYNKHNSKQKGE